MKQDIAVYANKAEIVARIFVTGAEIYTVNHDGKILICGQKVSAQVAESYKGGEETVDFFIQGHILDLASEYLVFLRDYQRPNVVHKSREAPLNESIEQAQKRLCRKYYVGLEADWKTVSQFMTRRSSTDKEWQEWITPAYIVKIPKSADIEFQSIKLRALKVNGEIVEKDYWNLGNDIVIPHIFWMYKGVYRWKDYKKHLLKELKG
ncbi:hypothetical protein [Pseudoteredinibacter isoporae]|nr:hypothetical protein [Pseudoteredinibacter isoporae]